MVLRILYACTVCGAVGDGHTYNLRAMWGRPIVCSACNKAAVEALR